MGRLVDAITADIVKQHGIVPNNVFFLDPVDGYTTGDGTLQKPYKTLAAAYAACTTEKNDCIVWIGKNDSSKQELTAGFTWAKNATHLLGYCADVLEGKRCRITQLSTLTGATLLTVSGANNIFANIRINQGVADATSLVNVLVSGIRNRFKNCEFAGIGNATQSAAGSASLKIDGGAENLFTDCVIGLDTIERDADATEILLDSAATRNTFRNCIIKSYISAAGFASVTIADGTGIDRSLIFQNCLFMTDSTNRAVSQTQVFSIPAIVQGEIVLDKCSYLTHGDTGVWCSDARAIIFNNSPAAAATGAGGECTTL
jgi:hypothetical protein